MVIVYYKMFGILYVSPIPSGFYPVILPGRKLWPDIRALFCMPPATITAEYYNAVLV